MSQHDTTDNRDANPPTLMFTEAIDDWSEWEWWSNNWATWVDGSVDTPSRPRYRDGFTTSSGYQRVFVRRKPVPTVYDTAFKAADYAVSTKTLRRITDVIENNFELKYKRK